MAYERGVLMPPIPVRFYLDYNTRTEPYKEWLLSLPAKARAAGVARLKLLHEQGFELHRPHAEYLKDGIYELRWKTANVNYRILYFFHDHEAILLSHGFTKQASKVPVKEIQLALARKRAYEKRSGKGT